MMMNSGMWRALFITRDSNTDPLAAPCALKSSIFPIRTLSRALADIRYVLRFRFRDSLCVLRKQNHCLPIHINLTDLTCDGY
jgi:hypothetical protein